MKQIKILIADAQYLAVAGLQQLLSGEKDFFISGIASCKNELLDILKTAPPEILIIDYNKLEDFSINNIEDVCELVPDTKTVIISSDNEKDNIFTALGAGIFGFLTKDCGKEEIVNALHASVRGEKFFCHKVLDIMLQHHRDKGQEDCSPSALSPRELQIVRLVAKGFSAKSIAELLHLSLHTVYTHRKNIMRKLNVNSASEMISFAFSEKLISAN